MFARSTSSRPAPPVCPASSRRRSAHPAVEALEDRLPPAVFAANSLADNLNPPAATESQLPSITQGDLAPGGNAIVLTVPAQSQQLATTTFLAAPEPERAWFGQNIVYIATVTAAAASTQSPLPTGTVTFTSQG